MESLANVQTNPKDEIERVRRMLAETKSKCSTALISVSEKRSDVQSSLQNVTAMQSNIDKFYDDFSSVMTEICDDIASSFKRTLYFKKGNHSKEFSESKVSNINECVELIKDKKRIVILTGSGISISCGIPGFSGVGAELPFIKDGIKHENSDILTIRTLKKNPDLFWERNLQFIQSMKNKQPSLAHIKIEELLLNAVGPAQVVTLVTSNMDGLHRMVRNQSNHSLISTGSMNIPSTRDFYEIHGNKDFLRCMNVDCDQFDEPFRIQEDYSHYSELVCVKCKKGARPHILYFDEAYEEKHYRTESLKANELELMDALIVIGSSLETGFAGTMVSEAVKNRVPIVEINVTPACEIGASLIQEKAELVVPYLCDALISHFKKNNHSQKENKMLGNNNNTMSAKKGMVVDKKAIACKKDSNSESKNELTKSEIPQKKVVAFMKTTVQPKTIQK